MVVCLVGPPISSSHAQARLPAPLDSLVLRGIRLNMQQAYPEAESIFVQIQRQMPDSPVGYFFHAATLQARMMDFERYDEEETFFALAKKTVDLARQKIRQSRQDAWAYFFLGGGLGYMAFYQGKQDQLLDAFQNGLKCVQALEMALRVDSTLYDAYFGLGTYKYFRSKLSRYLTWLPFVPDERRRGIELIQRTVRQGRYARYAATNGFCWIALEEPEYLQEGWQRVQQTLAEFPESRVFLWCAAKMATKLERWQEALAYYSRILTSLKDNANLTAYNEFICRHRMAEIHLKLEDYTKALQACARAEALSLDDRSRQRLGENLQELRKIKQASQQGIKAEPVPGSSH